MTAREFYQNKSNLLARVEAGETIHLTKRGKPIARISPENSRPEPGTPEWQAAYDKFMTVLNKGHWWGGKATYEERTE